MKNLKAAMLHQRMRVCVVFALAVYGCTGAEGDTVDSNSDGATGGGLLTGATTGAGTGGGATGAGTGATTGTTTGSSTGTGSNTSSVATGNQCVVAIPSGANVVDAASVTGATGEDWWVCRNSVLSLSGAGHVAYVDRGDVAVNGNGNTVYLTMGSDLSIFDGPNDYVIESGYTMPTTSGVTVGTVTVCQTLTYDTASAPSPGC